MQVHLIHITGLSSFIVLQQDVDIIILNYRNATGQKSIKECQEMIKQRLVEASSRFYLVGSQKPGATYQILWYHPSGRGNNRRPAAVKIDILLPGVTRIPKFNPSMIEYSIEDRLPINCTSVTSTPS